VQLPQPAMKRRRPDEGSNASVGDGLEGTIEEMAVLRSLAVSPHEGPSMPAIGGEPVDILYNGSVCMVWNPSHCARLRALGRLCATPIGLCSAKIATRGKAAAVPLLLNDEELWVCCMVATDWAIRILDSRTGALVDRAALFAKAAPVAADADAGFRHARRLVFADLWRRGYRCTNGLKFGCDYLSYTADASQVHAAFMVIVRQDDGEDADIAPMDLVAKSRVATTALKICVMAYGNTRTGAVKYAAFKRMGPGSAVFQAASALLMPTGAGAGFGRSASGIAGPAGGSAGGVGAATRAAAADTPADVLGASEADEGALSFLPADEAAALMFGDACT